MNIGPYVVISEIGRGGMGVVYKAQNPTNSNTVAIKMISGVQALDETHRMNLVREARTAGNLRHSNIVRVYDIGQDKGWLYLAMEYLEGEPLDRGIRARTSLSIRDKVSILIQLCNGLAYAHSFGIVHRDIKPANIFLVPAVAIKILDFGLAIGRDTSHPNQFAGTVPYMSPEQFQRAQVDCRSDIWSAGITMYELLVGDVPFRGKNVTEIGEQVIFASVPILGDAVPHRTEFQAILARALAKNRNDRYPSAKLLSTDLQTLEKQLLQEVTDFEPELATPPRSPSIQSDNSLQTTLTAYGGVDLKLRTDRVSTVSVRRGNYYLVEISRKLQQAWKFAVFGALFLPIAVLDRLAARNLQDPLSIAGQIILYVTLPVLVLWPLLLLLLKSVDLLGRYPSCQACSLPMSSASRWTRFVNTNSEVVLGYRDCLAALMENLWQDAAKLLCIHGSEPTSLFSHKLISTPLRYHLHFYECLICGEQAARLTTDDLIEDNWISRIQFTDVYRAYGKHRSSVARILRAAPSRLLGALSSFFQYADPLRFDKRVLAGIAAYGVIIGVLVLPVYRMHMGMQQESAGVPTLAAKTQSEQWIGNRYFYGYGIPRNRRLAAQYYFMAAREGDGFSSNQLGLMHENAWGVSQDYRRATRWYWLAARQGNSEGAVNLGRMLENGIGVDKDLKQAEYWYGVAAVAGNLSAKSRLDQLRSK